VLTFALALRSDAADPDNAAMRRANRKDLATLTTILEAGAA
jgi:hypothetical protein